jgi:hypothetical protein
MGLGIGFSDGELVEKRGAVPVACIPVLMRSAKNTPPVLCVLYKCWAIFEHF